jgi:autotransporter passenger strand-loop-strand repeat protein
VEAGGTANSATVSAGGIQYDYGSASGAIVSNGGSQMVSGGTAFAVLSSGFEYVSGGGTASGTTISDAGSSTRSRASALLRMAMAVITDPPVSNAAAFLPA